MDYHSIFSEYEYFKVNVNEYDGTKNHFVTRPASMNHPRDNAVMFIMDRYLDRADAFLSVKEGLIFWPEGHEVPSKIKDVHAICLCENTHLEFCRFFKDHGITNHTPLGKVEDRGHYLVSGDVNIGEGTQVFPHVFINGNVTIGKDCYIGAGVKIVGNVRIGDRVIIKENTVLGADGLTTDRDADGSAVSMPQFGGLIIEDDVQIGANTAIARGAIDNTVIRKGCKIDNCCWVSHNNYLDENVFMVGESTCFGSVTIGKNSQISGNATIREGITVGENTMIGAGAVVTRNIGDNAVVAGNPARELHFPR